MRGQPVPAFITSQTITRPADTTAYASGDLMANSTTAGSVTPFAFLGSKRQPGKNSRIRRVQLRTSNATITNGSARVHFFTALPVPANGDNGALSIPVAQQDDYVGYIDVVLNLSGVGGGTGWSTPGVQSPALLLPGGNWTTLYAMLEARAAYTPASGETFTLVIEVEKD